MDHTFAIGVLAQLDRSVSTKKVTAIHITKADK